MKKEERIKYKKKKQLYEKLGAKKFQKIVFGVEKLKFKLLKTICPNFIKYFDKYCDLKQKRILKKVKSQEEKKQIIESFKFAKMAMRKEFYQEKNRNYHIDNNDPTDIYKYLELNKQIHKDCVVKNAILIPLFIGGIALGITVPAIILLCSELISLGINFECINIQNYNMCRYKLTEDIMKRRREKRLKENIENYGEASRVIHEVVESKEKIPSMTEIISSATSKEQLLQLRELLLREARERNLNLDYNRGNK